MTNRARELTGLILGFLVGLLIANLLGGLLFQHGHNLSGTWDVVIVVIVSVSGVFIGASTGTDGK
jgi:Na+/proline symporter